MNQNDTIIFSIRALANQIKRFIDKNAVNLDEGLTGMQIAIIGYIGGVEGKFDVFQKDIEEAFNIRRSSATRILKFLEQEGYLTRIRDSEDERYKRLDLTKKSEGLYKKIIEDLERNEEVARKSLTKKEIETFFKILDKIMKNMSC
ncbi:MarR family winged helix-turn-helix transcriptional regulator [Sebaldella sp. S0638]|uniref:MarR family winged helix-turn-helix transcriptional regulator n=1 Tax=Sebaldella sp. S0638 TaxID=2957809 RepID=UPI0020A1A018|nr:MarR family winged helix-turn-helix transcriptional regulator [Sebaldella sp. S0638]MCP1225332.1 MarR family winged helix-turn-helix transcriptional regulator [Sebaldella sp. S0638]